MNKVDEAVIAANSGDALPLVYTSPVINGKRAQQVVKYTEVNFKNDLVRIQQQADPVGFLMAVVNGSLFETAVVDKNGQVTKRFEQASLKERIKAARYLTDKIIPRMGVIKHELPGDGASPGRSFAQLVEMAASNEQ